METKKSIITELNLQPEKFNDMFIFTIVFENTPIVATVNKPTALTIFCIVLM